MARENQKLARGSRGMVFYASKTVYAVVDRETGSLLGSHPRVEDALASLVRLRRWSGCVARYDLVQCFLLTSEKPRGLAKQALQHELVVPASTLKLVDKALATLPAAQGGQKRTRKGG